MSTENKIENIDKFLPTPDAKGLKVGIVVAEWNKDITHSLLKGAKERLERKNVSDIIVMNVPGAFELINGASRIIKDNKEIDGIIVIGAVIKGDTPHFDYICQGVTNGIAMLNVQYPHIPTIFCVLTTNDMEQALERAGGRLGNKGEEASDTLIKMCRPYIDR